MRAWELSTACEYAAWELEPELGFDPDVEDELDALCEAEDEEE